MGIYDISVVMSVYNNEDTLASALESILSQEGVELEFIVIDDGSTDGSAKMLDEFAARDSRLKVVHKANAGLTKALIEGCALACAPWIARQDADDLSMPDRLVKQLTRARQSDSPVLVACGVEYRTPEGIGMFPVVPEDNDLNKKIIDQGQSPCAHGAALFSKAAYDKAGGYRSEFYYAQDLDLFTRLATCGPVVAVPDVLYAYTFSPYSTSTHSALVQEQFRKLICRSDASVLQEAAVLSDRVRQGHTRKKNPFDGYYFIGCCLRKKDPATAVKYFRKALSVRPWSAKAGIRLLCTRGGAG